MSVERAWRWRCDLCSIVIVLRDAGLPWEWKIYHREGQTLHACASCRHLVPDATGPETFGGIYAPQRRLVLDLTTASE